MGNDQKSEVCGRVWHQTTVGSQIPERRIAKKMAALPLQTPWRDTKPLLFQAVPPLDSGLFEGWPEECFHHPPKHDAPAFRELKQVNRPAAVLIQTLESGRSQTDYSRCWTNSRISASVQSSAAGGGPSLRQAAAPSTQRGRRPRC